MINQISRIIDTETRGGTKIIFLHHSTGRLLLLLGRVRNLLKTKNEEVGINYELWDHDYNRMGLTGPTGKRLNVSFEIPQDNTDPDGLDVLFAQEVHNHADNALSYLLKFNVAIFK